MKYSDIFQRNIGVFTKAQQEKIRNTKVSIGGLGGVGGILFERLVRLGIENFHVSDPENFELSNLNRQIYSNVNNINNNKSDILIREMKSINPNLKIKNFKEGINSKNVKEFTKANIVVDAIEYNLPYIIYLLHRSARENGVKVLAGQALGFGASLYIFKSNGVKFEDYIGLENPDELSPEDINKFKIPVKKFCPELPMYVPKALALKIYLRETYIPSCSLGVMVTASLIEMAIIKIILDKKVRYAPDYYHLDVYKI